MRLNPLTQHRQRAELDRRSATMAPALGPAPRRGWIRAVRESLGMPAEQLDRRLGGISKQAVLALEAGEVRRSASLQSLERAAAALGCRLTYAVLPEPSLEAILDQQATRAARRALARTRHAAT